jgi:hypothetical protein
MLSDESPLPEYGINKSRNCYCCQRRLVRVQLPAPKLSDPEYKIAVCPKCDGPIPKLMNVGE